VSLVWKRGKRTFLASSFIVWDGAMKTWNGSKGIKNSILTNWLTCNQDEVRYASTKVSRSEVITKGVHSRTPERNGVEMDVMTKDRMESVNVLKNSCVGGQDVVDLTADVDDDGMGSDDVVWGTEVLKEDTVMKDRQNGDERNGFDSVAKKRMDEVWFGGDWIDWKNDCKKLMQNDNEEDESEESVDLLESSCVQKQVVPISLVDYGFQDEEDVMAVDADDDGTRSDGARSDGLVWGAEASARDIVQIKRMLHTGAGVVGCFNCKLEIRESLLEGAGRGVFIKEGCTIRDGECITQYSGQTVRSGRHLSLMEQLRTIEIGSVFVVGKEKLSEGDGFGSIVNSSVVGRTLSFCRFVSYNNSVYIMAYCKKPEYPLRGLMELYLTAGSAWWSLFNSVREKGSRKNV